MRIVIAAIAATLLILAAHPAQAINGFVSEIDGQRIMRLWGSNYEMGYAHGSLIPEEIVHVIEIYSIRSPEGDTLDYDWKRDYIMETFDFPEKLLEESQGIFDAMEDSGISLHMELLGRNLDRGDLLTFIAMRDIAGLFCTTLAGWNTTTATDPELLGEMAVAHNTDFRLYAFDPFFGGDKGIIIAFEPDDPDKQRFISVTFPGFIGIVSGMNESGIGLTTNRGGYEFDLFSVDPLDTQDIGVWSTRQSLAQKDYNGDERNTIEDVLDYYENVHQFGSLLIHIFGPEDRSDPPTAVQEINYHSRVVRWPEDDEVLFPDMELTFNWEDKLFPVRDSGHALRYFIGANRINNEYDRQLTLDNLWDFLDFNHCVAPICLTFHSAIFRPGPRQLGLSRWSDYDNDPTVNHTWLDFEEIFDVEPMDDDVDDDVNDDADDDVDDDLNDDADDDVDDDLNDDADDDTDDDDDWHGNDDTNDDDDDDSDDGDPSSGSDDADDGGCCGI